MEVSTFEVPSGVTIPHELRRRVEEAVGMGPSKLRYFIYRCRTNKPVQSLGLDGDIFVTVSKQNKEIVYYRSSGIWVAYPPSNWSANSPVTNRHPLVRGIYLLHLPVLGWFPLNGSMLREARNHTTELLGPLGPLPASQPVVAQTSRHPSIPPLPATQPVNPTVSTWRASLGRPRSSRSLSRLVSLRPILRNDENTSPSFLSGRVSRGSSHGTPEEGGSSVKHPSPVQGASPTSQIHRIKLEEPEVEELEVTRHDDSWQTPSLIRDIENTPQPPLSFVANPPLKSVPSQWMSTPLQGAISPIPNTGRFHLTLPRTNGDKPTSSSIASSPSSFPTSNPPKSASECPPPATMENHDTPPAPSIIVERKSKRPRSDSSVSSTFEGQKYTPNARFWAQDGNIILAIGNVLFKLYRTRLSQASQHFARIFQSLDADTEDISRLTPGYEDCTVVPVSGVSPDDFEQLLVALDSGL